MAAIAVPAPATALGGALPTGADAELLELGRKLAPSVAQINEAKKIDMDDHFWGDILDKRPGARDRHFDDMWDEDNPLQLPSSMATFFKNA
jgi:hypothetical protein